MKLGIVMIVSSILLAILVLLYVGSVIVKTVGDKIDHLVNGRNEGNE
jgi:hypothetical protein